MTYESETTHDDFELTVLKDEEKLMFDAKEHQRLESLWWAGALIWAGLVFAADSLSVLPQFGDADAWSWVFLGAGLYGFAMNLWRTTATDYPEPKAWDWLWSGIFVILGLGGLIALDLSWPLILLLVGGVTLAKALWRR